MIGKIEYFKIPIKVSPFVKRKTKIGI